MSGTAIVVFKTELNPNASQRAQLSSHIGAARFAYNCLLAHVEQQRHAGTPVSVTPISLQNIWVHELRDQFASDWWSDNAADAYRSGSNNLADAYKRFFSGQNGHPRFKKRGGRESYVDPQSALRPHARSVRLGRVGDVRLHERLKGAAWLLKCGATLQAVTVSREATGRYYASLRLRIPEALMVQFLKGKFSRKGSGFIGVDLGLKEFATTSDGLVVPNPRFLRKLEAKLAKAQQAKAHKYEAREKSNWAYEKSKSEHRAQKAVARVHRKIRNQRREYLIATARELVSHNKTLVLEDLNVKGMLANHSLAKSVSDASWSEFNHWMSLAAGLYGTEVIRVDRFYPSSKTCSSCGSVKAKLTLAERAYECQECGLSIDRDLNAALNLRAYGLAQVAARCAETQNGGGDLPKGGSNHRSKEPRKTRSKASQEDASPQEQPSTLTS